MKRSFEHVLHNAMVPIFNLEVGTVLRNMFTASMVEPTQDMFYNYFHLIRLLDPV